MIIAIALQGGAPKDLPRTVPDRPLVQPGSSQPRPGTNPQGGSRPGGGVNVDIGIHRHDGNVTGGFQKRFNTVIKSPPRQRPPYRPGGNWRWHSGGYGWVWFPQGTAPVTYVLPPNYILPQQVPLYQPRVMYVTCPSCGEVITVEVP